MTNTQSTETPVFVECAKCSGTGSVSWGVNVSAVVVKDGRQVSVPNVCFDCGGEGGWWSSVEREERLAKRRASDAERRARKARERAEANWAAVAEARPDVAEALTYLVEREILFGLDVRNKVERYGLDVFESTLDAVVRVAEEEREREAKAAEKAAQPVVPVPEGRETVTGRVVSTKWVDNSYGGALKMLVEDDRGFRVFGTVPASLDVERGARVTFTATLTRSGDDEGFGFYKRPTKASKA